MTPKKDSIRWFDALTNQDVASPDDINAPAIQNYLAENGTPNTTS